MALHSTSHQQNSAQQQRHSSYASQYQVCPVNQAQTSHHQHAPLLAFGPLATSARQDAQHLAYGPLHPYSPSVDRALRYQQTPISSSEQPHDGGYSQPSQLSAPASDHQHFPGISGFQHGNLYPTSFYPGRPYHGHREPNAEGTEPVLRQGPQGFHISMSYNVSAAHQQAPALAVQSDFPILNISPASLEANAYQVLTGNGVPSLERAVEYCPFRDMTSGFKALETAILKIEGVHWDVTKNEILAYLGHDAEVAEWTVGVPKIHILMARSSGRTSKLAFAEMVNEAAAKRVIRELEAHSRRNSGRPRLLGNSRVNTRFGGYPELMTAMFAKAKATFVRQDLIVFNQGFSGFLSSEELEQLFHLLKKPLPSGSSHTQPRHGRNSPQRPYEDMMSIMMLFPWGHTGNYTVEHRNVLYAFVFSMTKYLMFDICVFKNGPLAAKLNDGLLRQFVLTATKVPAFHASQRSTLWGITNKFLADSHPIPCPDEHRLCQWHPFYCLDIPLGTNVDLAEYFALLIKEGSTSRHLSTERKAQMNMAATSNALALPWGDLTIPYSTGCSGMTFATCAAVESRAIRAQIAKTLSYARCNQEYCTRFLPGPDDHPSACDNNLPFTSLAWI